MYRKTPSNTEAKRPALDGVLGYIRQARSRGRRLLERHPLYFFAGMLACMLGSGILAFTVMRVDVPRALPPFPQPPASGAGSGITGIIGTYGAIREVAGLQETIASIIGKDTLDTADSIRLVDALERLDRIHNQVQKQNPQP